MRTQRQQPILWAIVSVLVVFAAGGLGSAATLPNIPTWYAGLHKPAFTPPNWIFGPVWTCLYILMSVAFWRILTHRTEAPTKPRAVLWFLIQIVLNALWSFAFFGLHSPLFGLGVIAVLWVAIVFTIITFWTFDKIAGLLLVPYLLWVSYASALNASVYWLNR